MRFATALFLLLGGLVGASSLQAADYALDAEHSNVQFSVPFLAVSKITGKFMKYDVRLDAGKNPDLSRASVVAVIQMGSVDTGNDAWDRS